ncbi:MOB kinase activator-like 2 isoform X3 [Drosophila rhopaloa]|uniref:MOB kinase activator-like 2 n=1 Tax=Drosophila rhopaloa TaxID=1041015 RepID=A0ABM5HLT6_DRORH|nr:MOB kinase activator-like 2 isoform X3 [Drosophila rhopaloa]XP_016982260.2 MOB kinase activator-like 2 isoform X3 [Drosophila rhopaloa]
MKETLSSKVPIKIGVTFVSESDPKRKLKSSPSTSTSTISTTTTASPPPPQTSYVIKCLLRTARFMWQVTTIPSKIGDTIGTLYRYAQDSVDSFLCVAGKARRKERDGDQNSTDTKLYLEESVLERKLPEADLKALVDLPAGLDYNEWLASHTLALFEHVNLVYGTISEFCTQSGCADMTGPGNRTYLWFDEKGKKTRVAAPQYIDYVMTFTQKTVSDESIFPTKYANEFPGSFESIARKILRLQFHVIAHLYAAHFREIALLGLHTHLNLTFAHLTALHRRFNLIDEKETDVLRDLEVALRLTDDTVGQDATSSSSLVNEHTSSATAGDLQHQSPQQQQHHNSSSNSNSTSSAEALHIVNSQSNNGSTSASASASASVSLIDGDAVAPPICTQPEAGAGCKPAGSSGLLGGILGDLTSGEFGDTTRYCTSAVPQASAAAAAAAGGGVSTGIGGTDAAALNNGAGALHLNFSNNNNNNHLNHHHHHHHGHHGHHHHAAAQQHQHSGLIQCNAAGGGGAATGGVATGGATAAASSTTTA